MKPLIFILFIASIGAGLAEEYKGYGISFEVPGGWHVTQNNTTGTVNDTKIVLTDNESAIRIDVLKGVDIDKQIKDYLRTSGHTDIPDGISTKSWREIYAKIPWYSNGAMLTYYMDNVIEPVVTSSSCSGSGISVKPDDVAQAGVSTNNGQGEELSEWSLAWTRPDYNNAIIGVHSLTEGNYAQKRIIWNGAPHDYAMAEPLWIVLKSIKNNDLIVVGGGADSKPWSDSLVDMV